MKTLIVHESLFGNTKAVADAIERGLVRGTEPARWARCAPTKHPA